MASLGAEYDVVLVARAATACCAADVRPLVRISVTVIVEAGRPARAGLLGRRRAHRPVVFTEARLEEYAHKAVDLALVNLQARPAPAGEMTVVLGPGWPGILLHEAIGHGLEGDFNRKGSSAFSGRIGERVAAQRRDRGRRRHPARPPRLAEHRRRRQPDAAHRADRGRHAASGYIQDTLNARLMKVPTTGNGRRESFAHLPMPRMTNTVHARRRARSAGNPRARSSTASTPSNFGGGQVDITNGKFVFGMAEAYLIEDGRITDAGQGRDADRQRPGCADAA